MKKRTKILLLALMALCLLTACKKEEGPLEAYNLGESEEDSVVALDSILDEGEAMLYSIDAPTDQAIAEKLDISHTYHYRQMDDPAALAERYIRVLMGEEQGFVTIDGENHRLEEEPVTDILAGSVSLAKAAEEFPDAHFVFIDNNHPVVGSDGNPLKNVASVIVGWSEYAVAVQVAYIDGKILPPVKEEEPEEEEPQPTAMSEQLDFFNTLDPGKLGLEGDDMTAYMVYPQQGWVLLDGVHCRQMQVYLQDVRTATNVFMGTYYLSSDMSQLFRETGDGEFQPIDLE